MCQLFWKVFKMFPWPCCLGLLPPFTKALLATFWACFEAPCFLLALALLSCSLAWRQWGSHSFSWNATSRNMQRIIPGIPKANTQKQIPPMLLYWSQPFFYWRNFAKKRKLNIKNSKKKSLLRFWVAKKWNQ